MLTEGSVAVGAMAAADNAPMHLLVPFAAPLSEPGRQALKSLSLPRLEALLARLAPGPRDAGDEYSLSPPHERALAGALGLAGGDGRLPWAAWQAAQDGIDPGDAAWALLSPAHWHLGTDQVGFTDPLALALDEATSRALLEAVRELFESEGFTLRYGAPQRWYAAHDSLADLSTASLDRVIGRNVDRWLVADPRARLVKRLQNEVQMLLYTHPINAAREELGLPVVNSFWLSGCGRAQPVVAPAGLSVDERLRAPALAEDWAAWTEAWRALDAALPPPDHTPLRLTLCGERAAATFESAPRGLWQRLGGRFARPQAWSILESL